MYVILSMPYVRDFFCWSANIRTLFDLQLETNDPRYENNQAKNTFEQHAYVSPSNAYIAITRTSQIRLEVTYNLFGSIFLYAN